MDEGKHQDDGPVTDQFLDDTIVEVEDILASIDEEFTIKVKKSKKFALNSSSDLTITENVSSLSPGQIHKEQKTATNDTTSISSQPIEISTSLTKKKKKPVIKQSKLYKKLKLHWTRHLTDLKWIKFRRFLDQNA